MNDPFDTRKVNRQLMREAKIGLAMVIVLGGFFTYVGYFRMGNFRSPLPAHIIDAPLATNVGQDYYKQFQTDVDGKLGAYATRQELGANAGVNESRPKSRNPFQLPKAVRNIRESIDGSFTGPEFPEEQKSKVKTKRMPRVASNQTAWNVNSGSGPIPIDKLKSESPNSQNEFDIARSGPDGTPQPFNASMSRMRPAKIESGVTQPEANGDFVKPPEARTAREISVTEKDQSSVQRPSSDFLNDGVVPSSWDAPVDLSRPGASIATTEAIRSLPSQPAIPSKPIPSAFTRPRSLRDSAAVPQPVKAKEGARPEPSATSLEGRPFEEHRVKSGESFWSLSQRYLNEGRLFRALYEHNLSRVSNFENLTQGTRLEIPTANFLVERYPELVPADLKRASKARGKPGLDLQNMESYITESGETLFGIAKEKYGQASRYLDILDANQERLPDDVQHMSRLPAGLELRLPR